MGLVGQCRPAGFAAWCTPEVVIISGGRSRDATAAITAYEGANAQVHHTAESGAITLTLRSESIAVGAHRRSASD